MNDSGVEYADYAEYDRRQRGIERHLLTTFLGGLVVGLVSMFLPGPVADVYDPYAFLALAIAAGATASGFGWALLTSFLAVASSVVATMGVGALLGNADVNAMGGGAMGLNVLMVMLVALGLLAYLTRRADRWGDVAAGAVSALLLSDVIDRSTRGLVDFEPNFWPWPALLIGALAVGLLVLLRREWAATFRALAVSAILVGAFLVAIAAL